MAVRYRSQGLVINKIDRGDSDQVFKIYTQEFGRLDVLGKAVRKITSKLRGGADLFYLSDIEFIQGRTRKTLTDADIIEGFPSLKKDFKRIRIGHKMAEVVERLTGAEEKDVRIWKLLSGSFLELDRIEDERIDLLYYYFIWNFLSLLGYLPELYSCSICQNKVSSAPVFFNSPDGGMVCGNCGPGSENSREIDQNLIKILRIIIGNDWKTASRIKMEEDMEKSLKEVSRDYLDEILDKIDIIKSYEK